MDQMSLSDLIQCWLKDRAIHSSIVIDVTESTLRPSEAYIDCTLATTPKIATELCAYIDCTLATTPKIATELCRIYDTVSTDPLSKVEGGVPARRAIGVMVWGYDVGARTPYFLDPHDPEFFVKLEKAIVEGIAYVKGR